MFVFSFVPWDVGGKQVVTKSERSFLGDLALGAENWTWKVNAAWELEGFVLKEMAIWRPCRWWVWNYYISQGFRVFPKVLRPQTNFNTVIVSSCWWCCLILKQLYSQIGAMTSCHVRTLIGWVMTSAFVSEWTDLWKLEKLGVFHPPPQKKNTDPQSGCIKCDSTYFAGFCFG